MLRDSNVKETWGWIRQPGLLAGGAGLMASACLAAAVWAALQFPPAGWLCYFMSLGWILIGCLCFQEKNF